MIQYRRILELYFREVTQRTICASVGHSRYTVSEIFKGQRIRHGSINRGDG